jgi:ABC-type uncharacterized transport system involved in gliding motility auxiliary subunit
MDHGYETGGPVRAWGKRKFAISLNTLAALALAALLVLMVNYLSYRHNVRMDWSRSRYYSLSDKTLSLLSGLTNRVDVIVFFQPGHNVYEDVHNLLKEYEYASPLMRVEWVDPDRDLARTEELMRKYQVDQANVVVFDAGGRSKYVTARDIAEYDYTPVQFGQSPERVAFKGEQGFSSAIQSIVEARRPVVYFLQGHGERDVESFNRSAGYSSIAEEIKRDNVDVRTLTLGEAQAIPGDCDALVIAGPEKRISEQELDLIRNYIEQKGRLLVMLDAMTQTGLEPLMADWGIRLADDVVVDATRTLSGRELFITRYEPHPITGKLKNETSILYLPRSVEPAESAEAGGAPDKPRVMPLAACSDAGWAESDLTQNPMKFDAGVDRPGPVAVAVAAERGPVPGIDVQIRPTRVVVFGDSDFVSNAALTGGNTDFFLSALNWLLERSELMAIAPKPIEQNQLTLTEVQLRMIRWIMVVAMPLLVAAVGGVVWLRRRS